MPIYYKKVNDNTNDLSLLESGFGGGGNSSSSGIGGNFFNNFKSLSLTGNGSQPNEVELDKIHCSLEDDHQMGWRGDEERATLKFYESKVAPEDRDHLNTRYGPLVVVKQLNGNQASASPRPVIITYHDIGLNFFSNFESFFNRLNIRNLLQGFRIYHINAPGQEENAEDLPPNYLFPKIDDLAEQVLEVCRIYNIQEFIGFGYGAGANVLSRVALSSPDMVEALFLINPSATTSTWVEWFYQKINLRTIYKTLSLANAAPATNGQQQPPLPPTNQLPESIQSYFMWHVFGNTNMPDRPIDEEAMAFYRRYFESSTFNLNNLAQFISSYIDRSGLSITREDTHNNFKCPVAVVCGDYSPHIDESVKMNARLDPTNSTWMKLGDCAMILEEQPNKVEEVLRLFLQGLGYTLKRAGANGSTAAAAFLTNNNSISSSHPQSSASTSAGSVNQMHPSPVPMHSSEHSTVTFA